MILHIILGGQDIKKPSKFGISKKKSPKNTFNIKLKLNFTSDDKRGNLKNKNIETKIFSSYH